MIYRKRAAVAALALFLVACSASADEQFEDMYARLQREDPATAAEIREVYEGRQYLSDEQKMEMVQIYEQLLAQRKVVEDLKEAGRREGYEQ